MFCCCFCCAVHIYRTVHRLHCLGGRPQTLKLLKPCILFNHRLDQYQVKLVTMCMTENTVVVETVVRFYCATTKMFVKIMIKMLAPDFVGTVAEVECMETIQCSHSYAHDSRICSHSYTKSAKHLRQPVSQ